MGEPKEGWKPREPQFPMGPPPHVCPWWASSCLVPGEVRSGLDSGSELGQRRGALLPLTPHKVMGPAGRTGPYPSGVQMRCTESCWPLSFTPGLHLVPPVTGLWTTPAPTSRRLAFPTGLAGPQGRWPLAAREGTRATSWEIPVAATRVPRSPRRPAPRMRRRLGAVPRQAVLTPEGRRARARTP